MSGEFSPCADHVRTTPGRAGPAVRRSSLTLRALPPGRLPTWVKLRIQSRALYIFPWLLLYLPSAPTGPIKEHRSLPATHPFSRARLFLEPPRLQSRGCRERCKVFVSSETTSSTSEGAGVLRPQRRRERKRCKERTREWRRGKNRSGLLSFPLSWLRCSRRMKMVTLQCGCIDESSLLEVPT